MGKRSLLCGGALVIVAGCCNSALADEAAAERNVSVTERRHEGSEPLGLQAGGFRLWPSITASVETDDNIYAAPALETDDVATRIQSQISLDSMWSRHSLNAYLRADTRRYRDQPAENAEHYTAGISGRLDVQREARLSGNVDTSRLTEPRTAASAPAAAARPVRYTLAQAQVMATKAFNRLRLTGGLDRARFDYDDAATALGGVIDQDNRDRVVTTATLRADYSLGGDTAVFVKTAFNQRDYDAATALSQERNSSGAQMLVGVAFDAGGLARGEVAAGYLDQSFDNPAFVDISGASVLARIEWFPTGLTTVTLTASRTVEDSGLVGEAGYISTDAGLQVDHELLRNLILSARLAYGEDKRTGRDDQRQDMAISAAYRLNRHLAFTARIERLERESTAPLAGFKQDKVSAGLTVQY